MVQALMIRAEEMPGYGVKGHTAGSIVADMLNMMGHYSEKDFCKGCLKCTGIGRKRTIVRKKTPSNL